MALANYTDLQAEVASYLARSDLTSLIPDFIKLTEAKLQRRFKGVTSLSSTVSTNWLFTANPDVYLYGALLEAQPYLQDDARISTWAQIFERMVAEVRRPDSASNFSNYAGLQAAVADWLNRPDLDVEIPNFIRLIEAKFQRKFKNVTNLSGTNTSNFLLAANPDIYLYGTLLQSAPYLKDDPRIPVWEQILTQLMAEIRIPDTASNFTNYSGLQASIADWLNRPDLANAIPNFIKLTEAKLQRRFVGVTSLSVSNTTNWVLTSHPDAYLYGALLEAEPYLVDDARIAIWKTAFETVLTDIRLPSTSANFSNYTGLQAAIADWLDRPDLANAIPNFIKLVEAKLQRRFKGVTSLSSSVSTNWLLTANPDAYLYGALAEASPYLKDDARIAVWEAAFTKYVAEIRLPDTASNFSNYTGLQAAIADWLNRPDLTNEIPNFIRLAEAQLQRRYVDVTSLSLSNATNWLLTSHPDIYLYASLLESAPYLKDDARVVLWQTEYDKRADTVRNPTTSGGFTSYTTLSATVADWLNLPYLTNVIPTFIQMAQERLSRELRVNEMLVTATTSTTSSTGKVELPPDFLEMREMHLQGNPPVVFEYQAPDRFFRNLLTTTSGRPYYYTIMGNEMQLAPKFDSTYTMQMLYYVKPTFISSTNASNIFLTKFYDALLYATLLEAEPYLPNDGRMTTWNSLYERAISNIKANDIGRKYPNTSLNVTVY
jgi:hypothetical protein